MEVAGEIAWTWNYLLPFLPSSLEFLLFFLAVSFTPFSKFLLQFGRQNSFHPLALSRASLYIDDCLLRSKRLLSIALLLHCGCKFSLSSPLFLSLDLISSSCFGLLLDLRFCFGNKLGSWCDSIRSELELLRFRSHWVVIVTVISFLHSFGISECVGCLRFRGNVKMQLLEA